MHMTYVLSENTWPPDCDARRAGCMPPFCVDPPNWKPESLCCGVDFDGVVIVVVSCCREQGSILYCSGGAATSSAKSKGTTATSLNWVWKARAQRKLGWGGDLDSVRGATSAAALFSVGVSVW